MEHQQLIKNCFSGRYGTVVEKGRILFKEGLPNTGIFYIQQGMVKVYKKQQDREFIMWVGFEGEFLGIDSLFSGETNINSCICIQNCRLLFIEREEFAQLLSQTPLLHRAIMSYLSEKSDEFEMRISNITNKKISQNIAEFLLTLCKRINSGEIPRIITTSDIAHISGTTTNYVYKIIQKMENLGVLCFKDRKLKVINRELLKKLSLNQYSLP